MKNLKMKESYIVVLLSIILYSVFSSCNIHTKNKNNMNYDLSQNLEKLTSDEEKIIIHKGTELPFTGKYLNNKAEGIYHCKQCGVALYNSKDKFESNCGWPSFDDEIEDAVKRIADPDGRRTEIVCNNCGGHLGHVFLNEGFTDKETRHCVNSISLKFKPLYKESIILTDETKINEVAYFASGCFWGTEFFFSKAEGVIETAVGFMGGHVDNPSYKDVCSQTTGHLEVVEVVYDPKRTNYENLVKLFFETHDFSQFNGQGPDIGPQYLSCIFYNSDDQKEIAQKYIDLLKNKGFKVATKLEHASTFWVAEDYHQQYYEHKNSSPYCHVYKKLF